MGAGSEIRDCTVFRGRGASRTEYSLWNVTISRHFHFKCQILLRTKISVIIPLTKFVAVKVRMFV